MACAWTTRRLRNMTSPYAQRYEGLGTAKPQKKSARRQKAEDDSDLWSMLASAAPIAGALGGTVIGGLAGGLPTGGIGAIPGAALGGAIGGGIGNLAGMGAGSMADSAVRGFEEEDEEAAARRALTMQVLGGLRR